MKQYFLTVNVDENALEQAYINGHDISAEECPDTESMILSELNWLHQSGISASASPIDSEHSIFIEWSIFDVRERADILGISIDDEQCLEILESLENNYDANFGISWDNIDQAIDNLLL